MRRGMVRVRGRKAGLLEENESGYRFQYVAEYLADAQAPSVSLTLPRRAEGYESKYLFPFFVGLLAEGNLKAEQCRRLKLDEADDFGRLLLTAGVDTIGAVTVHPEES